MRHFYIKIHKEGHVTRMRRFFFASGSTGLYMSVSDYVHACVQVMLYMNEVCHV